MKFLTVLLGFADDAAGTDVVVVVAADDDDVFWLTCVDFTSASALAASTVTAEGKLPCEEPRLEFRLELLDSLTGNFDSLFKDELERSSSPPRFLSPRPLSLSKRRTMLATLRGWPFLLLTSSDEALRRVIGLLEAEGIFSIRSLGSL